MLIVVLAHSGRPPAPHDLWVWNARPALLIVVFLAGWAYVRGAPRGATRGSERWRPRTFALALAATGVALASPVDALSGALASAHMVQHVLILLVAAPLFALSSPTARLVRGLPLVVRRGVRRCRLRLPSSTAVLDALRHPVAVWLLHVATVWFWHAAAPYDVALRSEPVHVVEHASFLVTGFLFWRVVIGPRHAHRVADGLGVLLVFAMAVQSVFLSALLTFAATPWYPAYAWTTRRWGLDPLEDQQLAGVVMWVPGGAVYLAVALVLLVTWVRSTDADAGERHRAVERGTAR